MKVYTSAGVLKTGLQGTAHNTLTGLTSGNDHTQYPLKSILTTKGDIYVATAASTPTRLGVSSDYLALVGLASATEGAAWGVPQGANASNFVGTGTFDVRWTGASGQTAPTTFAMSVDTLYAYPVFVPFTVAIDRLAFEVTTVGGANSKARCGVYDSTSRTNPAPNALLKDGGEFDTSAVGGTGMKELTVSPTVTLVGPGIFWFTALCGTAAPTVRALAAANCMPLVGWPSTGGGTYNSGISRAFSYAALPNPWGTPNARQGNQALVGIRF